MDVALKTPARVKVRIRQFRDTFYVLARNGKGWKVIDQAETRNKALAFIEQYHTDKDLQWSTDVKIAGGWVCNEEGCGETDMALLESHHIVPVSVAPAKRHKLDNGKCLCIFHHAMAHTGTVRDHILARLGLKLYGRLYPHRKGEIQRMAG